MATALASNPAPALKKCPSCGAPISFDPATQGLKCSYCGATEQIESGPAPDYHALAEPPPVPLVSAGTKTMRCTHCGATSEVATAEVATSCAFCASPLVEAQSAALPAEGVVPFAVTHDVAGQKFSEWLKGLWFRPSSLKKLAELKELRGVYVPSWIFDARAESSWTAEAGYTYYETETFTNDQGQTEERQVERIRWEPASGYHTGAYTDLVVSGSKGLAPEELEKVGPFQLEGALTGFHRDYLAGFEAEAPAVAPREAWPTALKWIESSEYSACESEVPGDTHRFLNVDTSTSDEAYRSVLVPMYVGAYSYSQKIYRVLVNGRTGETKGDAPWSFWKITFFVLFLAALAVAIYFAVSTHQAHP